MLRKIGIIGLGSFTKEILCNLNKTFDIFINNEYRNKIINEIKPIEQKYYCRILPLELFDENMYDALITISDIKLRNTIINNLPKKTNYYTYIDKNAILMDNNINIGKGSIICAGSIITTNVYIGDFSHINLNTTIGHDTKIGNFFTSAPGVNISGNCKIGNNVYIGTNSSIREKINICNNVKIGLNSGVIKNIDTEGIYIGTPCRKIKDDIP